MTFSQLPNGHFHRPAPVGVTIPNDPAIERAIAQRAAAEQAARRQFDADLEAARLAAQRAAQGPVPAPDQRAQVPQQRAQAPQQRAQAPQQRAQAPQQRVQAPQQRVQAPQQRVQAPQMPVQQPEAQQPMQQPYVQQAAPPELGLPDFGLLPDYGLRAIPAPAMPIAMPMSAAPADVDVMPLVTVVTIAHEIAAALAIQTVLRESPQAQTAGCPCARPLPRRR